ncbi:MAG: MTAP family purine nucleoside phosphorylase [Sphaerochaetaceae bacterium]|jgi:purine nucleoside phosphorylase
MSKAIIGGTGCYTLIDNKATKVVVTTRYGDVTLFKKEVEGNTVYILLRHKEDHSLAPHLIPYRAHALALEAVGVKDVIGLYAVGSITDILRPGSIGIASDFIDMSFGGRASTLFDQKDVRHISMDEALDKKLSQLLFEQGQALDIPLALGGTYVSTQGPRLETPSEIRLFKSWGCDYVGMTMATEVTLLKEVDIRCAALVYSINWASGIHSGDAGFIDETWKKEVVLQMNRVAEATLALL